MPRTRILVVLALTAIVSLLSGGALAQQDTRAAAEVKEISKAVGKPMHFSETKHFTFCTSVPAAKAKIFSKAAEKAFDLWTKHVGTDNWRSLWASRKCMVVILRDKKAYRKFLRWYSKKYPVWDAKEFVRIHNNSNWFPEPGTRNVIVTHLKPHKEGFVVSIVVHLVGHMIVDRYRFNNNFTPGWLRESTGMWFETQTLGTIQCSCYQSAYAALKPDDDRRKPMSRSKLRARVKTAVLKGKAPPMAGLIKRSVLSELTFADTLKGYAVVDWMMSQPKKYASFLRKMKRAWPSDVVPQNLPAKEKAQVRAFKEVFGLSLPELDKTVKEYVEQKF
ncbi:MAG TPA: hypothetical protein ENK43_03725 [Planctomycetes bacterium]|nr:hypothetical protein [Planctomycetota bacterium]